MLSERWNYIWTMESRLNREILLTLLAIIDKAENEKKLWSKSICSGLAKSKILV